MVCTGDWPRASLWGLVMAGQRFCMGFATLLAAPHHPRSAFCHGFGTFLFLLPAPMELGQPLRWSPFRLLL